MSLTRLTEPGILVVNLKEIARKLESLNLEKLTKWKTEFVESMTERLENSNVFSVRRLEVLDEIYENYKKHCR